MHLMENVDAVPLIFDHLADTFDLAGDPVEGRAYVIDVAWIHCNTPTLDGYITRRQALSMWSGRRPTDFRPLRGSHE